MFPSSGRKLKFILGSFMIGDVTGFNLQDIQTAGFSPYFVIFLSPIRIMLVHCFRIGHWHLLPNPPCVDYLFFFDPTHTHFKKCRLTKIYCYYVIAKVVTLMSIRFALILLTR